MLVLDTRERLVCGFTTAEFRMQRQGNACEHRVVKCRIVSATKPSAAVKKCPLAKTRRRVRAAGGQKTPALYSGRSIIPGLASRESAVVPLTITGAATCICVNFKIITLQSGTLIRAAPSQITRTQRTAHLVCPPVLQVNNVRSQSSPSVLVVISSTCIGFRVSIDAT